MTLRPAPKATTKKSKTPLLDKAKAANPHANGWDKDAAIQLAAEAADQTTPGMSLDKFLALATQYKDLAGWKNIIVATAVRHGHAVNSRFS